MAIDGDLLRGLEDAVEADTENTALHIHLIALLLSGGDADRALGHCQWILLHKPDSLEVILFAAQAAEALGEDDRAIRYRRVHDALEHLQSGYLNGCQ